MSRPEVKKFVGEVNRDYLHWEKFRHRPLPEGLTAEDAWAIVKLSRVSARRSLSLADEDGRPFSVWLPEHALGTLHEVDRGGGTTLLLKDGTHEILRESRDRILVNSLIEEAIATSQIEGAVTTRKVAKEMLLTNRKPRDRSEQMIVNSYRTIQLLRTKLRQPLSEQLLLEIQESMTADTLDDAAAAGRLRTADDNIQIVDSRDGAVVFVPPSATALPGRLERLLEFANSPHTGPHFIHPLVKAAILHFWLAYEHPFVDGNGRTARALFYWHMLRSGYWLFEFLTISRVIHAAPLKYYRSFLYSEHDDNDMTYSVVFLVEVTRKALAQLHDYLATKQKEQQLVARTLQAAPDLNLRQRAVVQQALTEPTRSFTFQSHSRAEGVTLVTARNDLLDLHRRGFLDRHKQGRQFVFVAPPDLPKRLRIDR
jgi:Fic family protein